MHKTTMKVHKCINMKTTKTAVMRTSKDAASLMLSGEMKYTIGHNDEFGLITRIFLWREPGLPTIEDDLVFGVIYPGRRISGTPETLWEIVRGKTGKNFEKTFPPKRNLTSGKYVATYIEAAYNLERRFTLQDMGLKSRQIMKMAYIDDDFDPCIIGGNVKTISILKTPGLGIQRKLIELEN